ncbi:MAG TPA: GntR family transcriptional regulator [Terriglobia bacterium]|nr:GntR family transcriptional regulator [Terriglobia bacterium]
MTESKKKFLIPPISAAAPGALYQQILDGIKREISEGRLAPGSPLPSFRGLAEDLMVSVITVKRAYEELEREGIIYRRQGLGTFVSDAAHGRSREVKKSRSRELLQEAVREGNEAGMSDREILQLLREVMEERGELAHVRKRH